MEALTGAIAQCSDSDLEKLVSLTGVSNTITKYDGMSKIIMKQIYDMIQMKDMQMTNLKSAVNLLTQLMTASAFATENGAIPWTGEGSQTTTVQAVCSAVLKEKCRRAGAAEARAEGN